MARFYVRQADGDNRDNGLTPRDAFADLHKALLAADKTPGADRIIVAPGSYRPTEIDADHVSIEARDGAVIDGGGRYSYGLLIRSDHVTVKNLDFTGIKGAAVTIKGTHHVSIVGCGFTRSEEAIFATSSDYLRFLRNDIEGMHSTRPGTQAVSVHNPKEWHGFEPWEFRIQIVGNHISGTTPNNMADRYSIILDNPKGLDFGGVALIEDNLVERNAKGILALGVDFEARDNLLFYNHWAGIAAWGDTKGRAVGNVVVSDDPEDFTFRPRTGSGTRIEYDDNTVWSPKADTGASGSHAGTPPQMPLAPEDHWHVYEPDVAALRHAWILDH